MYLLLCIALTLQVSAFNQVKAASSCQVYDQQPVALLGNETSCKLRAGPDVGCYDCCPFDWNCCDDGSCMEYDQFCRYPSTCCKEKYCGQQCCNSKHGVACGEVCAPLAYSCCNSKTSQMCKKPDTCCGDHCCPDTHNCCPDTFLCCEKGTACCKNKQGVPTCCQEGFECCGDHCCLKNEGDVCKSGDACCPGSRLCPDNKCCPSQDFCSPEADICCDNDWCESTKRCCHKGSHCNAEGGCCEDGQTFCPHGSIDNCFSSPYSVCCSDGGACTPDHPVCAGDFCCPAAYPKICSDQRLCHGDNGGDCACCGGDECCFPPYSCQDGGDCKHCHSEGSWWWKHTVCDYQPNHASHSDPLERPHMAAIQRPKTGHRPSPAQSFIARVSRAKRYGLPQQWPQGPGPVKYQPEKTEKSGVKSGIVLPPAPTNILSPNSFACFHDEKALLDPCTAFACFVEMTDCGATGYLKDAIALYCGGIKQYRHLFNPTGQKFLTDLQNCVTSQHVAVFKQGIIPCCNSLEKWGTGTMQLDCFKSSGFCKPGVFLSNPGAFDTLFNNDGSINIYTVWYDACRIQLP